MVTRGLILMSLQDFQIQTAKMKMKRLECLIQSPIMKEWNRSTTRKMRMHLVHLVRTLHLMILHARYNAIFNPSVSNSSCELSLNSRDERDEAEAEAENTRCKIIPKNNKTKKKTRKLTTSDLKSNS